MSQVEPRTYRVGIIGCGRIADSIDDELRDAPYWSLAPASHAGAYRRCAATEVVAGADTNAERLAAFGQRQGVDQLYADYREMLDAEELDVVSICTPTRSHEAIALDVAKRPVKGIFLEKPISQSLAEADRMLAAFQEANIKIAVNHGRTWDPVYSRIRELIADGTIGSPHAIVAHWKEGVLFGGTHLFDLLRYLLDAEAEWVFGRLDPGNGRFDPGARGMIGFPDDVIVYLNNADASAAPIELDIIGTEGRIRVGGSLYPELYVVDRSGTRAQLVRRGFPGVNDGRSGMLRAVEELVQAIETGGSTRSDAGDARADLEISVAFHMSHQTGGVVRLPVGETDYVIEDPWGRDN